MFEPFENIGELNILVIGDIILDKYVYGETTRISPEAPVPIVLTKRETAVLGGAANVATNLSSFGAQVHLIGGVGNDTNGDLVIEMARKGLNNSSGILKLEKITTCKTRIVAKGQQMLRIDDEDVREISESEENRIFDLISTKLKTNDFSGIVLQDYNKGIFSPAIITKIISLANNYNIPFFVDPKYDNFWLYQGAALFKPNLSEIIKANSNDEYISTDDLLLESARKLKSKILMCTLAERGIAYVEEEKIEMTPTQKVDVIDVSGAGDTSLAMMVIAYLLGYSTKSISVLANLCGKIVCMKSGVSTMTIDELKSEYYGIEENIAK